MRQMILITVAAIGFALATGANASDLDWSTYLGGDGLENSLIATMDDEGNFYVSGHSASTAFLTTPGAYDTTHNGGDDVFVAKFTSAGELVYCTLLGGSSDDRGVGIAIDAEGNAFVTGLTWSSDFPTEPFDAYDTTHNGNADVFVAKLSASGAELIYSTYLGSSHYDAGLKIVVDAVGRAHVIGANFSGGFPTTPDSFDPTYAGGVHDGIVFKLNDAGTELLYSTYLGGSGSDAPYGVDLDDSGILYITGGESSSDFPTTPDAYDPSYNGGAYDTFVVKLNPDGSVVPPIDQLIYSTYLGGPGREEAYNLKLDDSGAAYITGFSDAAGFPVTPGAYDETFNGLYDGFVTKIRTDGNGEADLEYSTYFGGGAIDGPARIDVDGNGNAAVMGYTWSTDFPTTPDAYDLTHNGLRDAFLFKLNGDGTASTYATFLGGSGDELGGGIAIAGGSSVFLTGQTHSTDFPTTDDAIQPVYGGGGDAFVSKLALALEAAVDIRPRFCPNRLLVNRRGFLRVAVVGTSDLDAFDIDPDTVRLAGVAPLRWSIDDVATPFEPRSGKTDCRLDCNREGPDGILDLVLMFRRRAVVATLGEVANGDCLVLELTGRTFDSAGGMPFVGEDVVRIWKRRGSWTQPPECSARDGRNRDQHADESEGLPLLDPNLD